MATRALIGYLENGVLTTTYNHYDGYPENLGKALNNFFNSPTLAKDIANYGYISYIDPETGDIEAANQDTPDKLDLNKMDPNQAVEEVAGLVDSYGADYAYFFAPNSISLQEYLMAFNDCSAVIVSTATMVTLFSFISSY